MAEIKKCPFCGSECSIDSYVVGKMHSTLTRENISESARPLGTKLTPKGRTSYQFKYLRFRPICTNPHCFMHFPEQSGFYTKEKAIAEWNKRNGK